MKALNDEQQTVVNAIAAMRDGDRLVVSGRAGSGKTFAIANAVANKRALYLTPTHPARTVLEQELTNNQHKVMTIHSAIGWYKDRDEDLETIEGYLPAKKAKRRVAGLEGESTGAFSDVDIIIVDEFSMVGAFLFGAIEDYAKEFGLPVAYSGDRFQLPPVKDREVLAKQGFPTITLTKSMRFSESSDIYRLGEMLRDSIENRPNEELPCLLGGDTVQVIPGIKWMNDLTTGYANGDDLLAVTSDNATLRRLRQKVRRVDHDQLCPGDVVTSKQTDEQFRNGERFTIRHVERATRVLPDVPGCVSRTHELAVSGHTLSFDGTGSTAFVLEREKDAAKLGKRIQRLYQKGKLSYDEARRVLDWLDEINRFELAALATVHKSQGRSVDTVYVDTATVLRKPHWLSAVDHKRLLYTA
ncbi:PIF1 family ATP-dependent DNA helicase, partial [Ruegeria sp. 1NDH52C]